MTQDKVLNNDAVMYGLNVFCIVWPVTGIVCGFAVFKYNH